MLDGNLFVLGERRRAFDAQKVTQIRVLALSRETRN